MDEDSILTSVKKLLGIQKDCTEFDQDVLMNINAAIFTLRQLGVVGEDEGFVVLNSYQTFEEYLGSGNLLIPQVKMYLYYKTKLGFDPPTSSFVLECMKEMIREAEWRLNVQAELPVAFKKGGEESK